MKAGPARIKPSCEPDWRTLLPVCLSKAGLRAPIDSQPGESLMRFTASARALHDGFMRVFGPRGWTDHKFIVLVVLSSIDPQPSTASELATHAAITKASMTDVLDRLERRGWIGRERDARDRRVILVKLTPKGRRAVAEAAALYLELAADIVASLPPDDLPPFERICERLATAGKCLGAAARRSPSHALRL